MAEKRICRNFMKNPKADPFDDHRLIPGKGPYRGYVMMCIENDFDAEYMLDEDFINGLSGKQRSASPTRSVSPSRSPRSQSPSRSTRNLLPLRSQPTLPRSTPSVIPDSLPSRSYSDRRLATLNTPSTQTVYPRVVAPSAGTVMVNRQPALLQQPTREYTRSRVPTPLYSERSEQIGTERFDPDPVTTVTKVPERSMRRTVQGPYGPNGENVVISGVHKLPGQLVYTTQDVPEHEVRSVHNGYGAYPVSDNSLVPVNNSVQKRVLLPPPVYRTRTEVVGNETFNPDPITTVTNIPPTSMRTAVRGPYGPSGENVPITGVYTSPGRRVYSTNDIPEHEVRSVSRSVSTQSRNGEF